MYLAEVTHAQQMMTLFFTCNLSRAVFWLIFAIIPHIIIILSFFFGYQQVS